MNKIKAFFDATGAFFLWCWRFPKTPIENFQDAKIRYLMNTDPELKILLEEFEKAIADHVEKYPNEDIVIK
jgi:hypothetical protein